MSGALERIDRDFAALEEAISTIAAEFDRAYSSYREVLSQASRQQLILVSFYICTQVYPEAFLSLTVSQRERLQQEIRQVADWGKQQLEEIGSGAENSDRPVDTTNADSASDYATDRTGEIESVWSSPTRLEPSPPKNERAKTPEQVVNWQQQMETEIAQILQALSNQVNRLLQQLGILPNQLPTPLLEAAKAEGFDSVGGAPNLLNFTIETENPDNPDNPNVTNIVAISLRLAEIELTDANCSAWRTQIRQLSQRLKSLAQQYERKRKEQATAQAESAWRSSWFEG
ncbi:MAG: hypothetical protein WBD58_04100 [Geitlerinemataceae cyanobacterium]